MLPFVILTAFCKNQTILLDFLSTICTVMVLWIVVMMVVVAIYLS